MQCALSAFSKCNACKHQLDLHGLVTLGICIHSTCINTVSTICTWEAIVVIQGKLEQTSSFSMLNCPTALSVFLLFLSVVEGLALQACLPLFHVRCLLLCSTATAAVAAEVLQEPAMDLSATFRQSMRFNLQGEHSLWYFLAC